MAAFLVLILVLASSVANAGNLCPNFYENSCPQFESIVSNIVKIAVAQEVRMAAKLLHLHFHDCFVNGCDASIALDDTPTFVGEKNASPNHNLSFGFEVIYDIKTHVEATCPGIVSCADILALAALDGVKEVGGPSWNLGFGRRDARTANKTEAERVFPKINSTVAELIAIFSQQGLNARDMTALSGAHTIGAARCITFQKRIYNDKNINSSFAATRQETCPRIGGNSNIAPFDMQTPDIFDNQYYKNLVLQSGLLHSDQVLYDKSGSQVALVNKYSTDQSAFFADFASAMTKMSNIRPLTGNDGEIRTDCTIINKI